MTEADRKALEQKITSLSLPISVDIEDILLLIEAETAKAYDKGVTAALEMCGMAEGAELCKSV